MWVSSSQQKMQHIHWSCALFTYSLLFILAYLNLKVQNITDMLLTWIQWQDQFNAPCVCLLGSWAMPEVDMWLIIQSLPTAYSNLVDLSGFSGIIFSSCHVMWTDWSSAHESLNNTSVNLLTKCIMITLNECNFKHVLPSAFARKEQICRLLSQTLFLGIQKFNL